MPKKQTKSERKIEIPLKYHEPIHLDLLSDVHAKWLTMLNEAELLVSQDNDLQLKAAQGLRFTERNLPVEVLGRIYSRYCDLINNMYDAYLNSVQLQRMTYMQEIISIIVKRMFELRQELVNYIVNDYIYVDTALNQLLKTPYDIQIVVPYHFAKESRPDSVENLLQKMWAASIKRQKRQAKRKSEELDKKPLVSDDDEEVKETQETAEEVEEEESEEDEESIKSLENKDFKYALTIQRHERFRQYFLTDFLDKSAKHKLYTAKTIKNPSNEIKDLAAKFVQKYYRRFMEIKRKRILDDKRDVLLGMVPDIDSRPKVFDVERRLLYEKRRLTRRKIDKSYQEQIEKTKKRWLVFKRGEHCEDITEEIQLWFKEWYFGYGFFPKYPYETEGGTILVTTAEYPTIEEQKEEDERILKATKGKTKEQLKQEKELAKQEAIEKKIAEAERMKAEEEALVKLRCNPLSDPGYPPKLSVVTDGVVETLRKYRQAWSLFDKGPVEICPETIYGFIKAMIMEDIMKELHLECRKYVDELMRLELKLLLKAHQNDYKRAALKWPKITPRKKPKEPPVPKPFIVDDAMLKSFEPLFPLNIISKPTTRFIDVCGDLNFGIYEANIKDPNATFPAPGYGDVIRRITLSCVFGSGVEPGGTKNKSVLLLGIPRNGKSFLADATAGELNAVKFDISPDVFSAKISKPAKWLTLVFQAARVFQPSVIFCKNIERLFYKKVPPEQRKEKAKALKGPLIKLLKTLPETDKVIFIATSSNPSLAKIKPMMKIFTEKILVPWPNYGSIQRYLYSNLQKIRSMPRDYCVQSLAQVFRGFGFSLIMEVYNAILTSERIIRLNVDPLKPMEFMEYLIEKDLEPMTKEEYKKLTDIFIAYSPLKAKREQYEFINMNRAEAYKTLEDASAKKAEGADKNGIQSILTLPFYELKTLSTPFTSQKLEERITLRKYRQAWSLFDKGPVEMCPETIYGFIKSMIMEDIMKELHLECRKYVDELMRLELKLLLKAHQNDYKRAALKWPKITPRKKPKEPPVPKPFIVDDAMLKSFEPLFPLNIISKPTTRFIDVCGDLNFGIYEANIKDPNATFPAPGYGDVIRRVTLSCVFGSGVEPGGTKNKSVLLLGIPRNGKSFLADATAGELNAVKFDISPDVFSAKISKPAKWLTLVFQAARVFQPSVIFCKNIERLFYKKVPPEQRKEKAKALKGPLIKLLKSLPETDKVIFIATSSNPSLAKIKPMMKIFTEKILVPWPNYGSIQRYLYSNLQKIRSMPRDYCVQSLAQVFRGFGFSLIMEVYNAILTSERIIRLNVDPLKPMEFMEYLIEKDLEPMTKEEYKKLTDIFIAYSPLKAKREQYELINMNRAEAYKTLEDASAKKAEGADKK